MFHKELSNFAFLFRQRYTGRQGAGRPGYDGQRSETYGADWF